MKSCKNELSCSFFLEGSGSNENDERVVIYDFITIVLCEIYCEN